MIKAIAAALTGLLLVAAPADAKTFRGKTSQGRGVTLTTGSDGKPDEVKVNYSARCRGGGRTIRSFGLFISPFKVETADAVEDGGPAPHSRGVRAGETARSTATLKGRREGERWTGTYRVRIVIRKGSKTVTVCQAKGVTWSVE